MGFVFKCVGKFYPSLVFFLRELGSRSNPPVADAVSPSHIQSCSIGIHQAQSCASITSGITCAIQDDCERKVERFDSQTIEEKMKKMMDDNPSMACAEQNDFSTTEVLSSGSCPEIPKDGTNQETDIFDATLRSAEQSQSTPQKSVCVCVCVCVLTLLINV